MQLFKLDQPTVKALPIVANIPHSGLFIPEDIAAKFTIEHLKSLPNSDWHLDKLYDFLPNLGITVLQATHNRYIVDLNRQIKQPLFGSFWSSVIPKNTAFNRNIYIHEPSEENIQERIEKYYLPYHHQLKKLLDEKIEQFGKVYLFDLHSFCGLINDDVCLGNVNNQTCSELLISTVDKCFSNQGLQVVRNKTFVGGYITRHYGEMPNVESLQIEVRYHVYLQENQIDKPQPPSSQVIEFEAAKRKFDNIFNMIVSKIFY
ncbi:MAG: N-formylglutamate amidohydrolase [Rivularia sp. (in: Bacteria)]|nr:N-formylglutamate amidohydrolase [Rivularia sp. MS3]